MKGFVPSSYHSSSSQKLNQTNFGFVFKLNLNCDGDIKRKVAEKCWYCRWSALQVSLHAKVQALRNSLGKYDFILFLSLMIALILLLHAHSERCEFCFFLLLCQCYYVSKVFCFCVQFSAVLFLAKFMFICLFSNQALIVEELVYKLFL